jgi:hypothetical protein
MNAAPHFLSVRKEHMRFLSASYAFRITAEPKDKTTKATNYFPKRGSVTKDADVYIAASNKDYLEISLDKPGG